MKKRLLSMFIVFVLMLSCMAAMAAEETLVETDLLFNGDMELIGAASPRWSSSVGLEGENVHGGEKALKQTSTGEGNKKVALNRDIKGLIAGEKYTISAWVYLDNALPTTNVTISVTPTDASGAAIPESSVEIEKLGKTGKWTLEKCEITMPEGVAGTDLRIGIDGGGKVIWDDISFVGKTTEKRAKEIADKKRLELDLEAEGQRYLKAFKEETMSREFMPGAENLLKNSGFEEGTKSIPMYWEGSNGGWDKTTFVATNPADVHSGKRAGIIRTAPDASGYPYISQVTKENIEDGKEYLLSAWVKFKNVEALKGVVMKLEFYNDPNNKSAATSLGFAESPIYSFNDNKWHNIKLVCQVPVGTRWISTYIRIEAPGEVVYDDVELRVAKPTEKIDLNVYKTFVYTESETATAYTKINTAMAPIEPGSYVEFSLKDRVGNVITTEKLPATSYVEWKFKTELMTEKKAQYFVGASYYDAAGNLIEIAEDEEIYKYDRPKRMDENGNYIDPLTGEIWYPSHGYSPSNEHDVLYMMSIGCNTFKATGDINKRDPEALLKQLDWYQEIGVKMCLSLYTPPAGYPTSVETVRNIVTAVKDHPAVYGYMLIDEPSLYNRPTQEVKTFDHIIDTIKEGYKIIREIDPNNLVYCLESAGATVEQMAETAKCTDVFATDPYPYQHETVPIFQISRLGRALEAMGGEFNLTTLIMAAGWKKEHYSQDIVTPEAVRHQTYQALWIGAHEYGYIPAHSDYGFKIEESPFVEGVESLTKTGEQAIVREHFHNKNTTLFANYQGKDFWMRSWIDKDGQMYLVLLNMTTKDVNVDMPFTSENGRVTVNSFTLTPVNGAEETITAADGRIKTTLTDIQSVLYKVTPAETVDTTLLAQDAFDDMGGHEWAKDAVELLNEKDIVNSKGVATYAPEEDITRADFAGFLIRTLGVEEKGAQNFADVDPNCEYAAEIATGKALGIFNGTGNNKFEPDAPISRQDLMTMCYRGMRVAGVMSGMTSTAWVDSFSDNGNISDYALEAIASMIENQVVKGNPDGTVNPLGNTTRAEAAVIMERILKLYPEYKRLLA